MGVGVLLEGLEPGTHEHRVRLAIGHLDGTLWFRHDRVNSISRTPNRLPADLKGVRSGNCHMYDQGNLAGDVPLGGNRRYARSTQRLFTRDSHEVTGSSEKDR